MPPQLGPIAGSLQHSGTSRPDARFFCAQVRPHRRTGRAFSSCIFLDTVTFLVRGGDPCIHLIGGIRCPSSRTVRASRCFLLRWSISPSSGGAMSQLSASSPSSSLSRKWRKPSPTSAGGGHRPYARGHMCFGETGTSSSANIPRLCRGSSRPNSSSAQRRTSLMTAAPPCKTRSRNPEKVPGSAHPHPAGTPRRGEPLDTATEGKNHIVNKHTVTVSAAAAVISLALLGCTSLVGLVSAISAGDSGHTGV
jgi:hypothetical protein